MDADLTLPVSRLPGVVEVAREVLGLDPWDPCPPSGPWHLEGPPLPGWPSTWVEWVPVVPLAIPAGRLVAATWRRRIGELSPLVLYLNPSWAEELHAACLYLGDLLRLCSALGVEVPAGVVPRLEINGARTWRLVGEDLGFWLFAIDDGEGRTTDRRVRIVPGLRMDASRREALDAIVKEVCGAP